MNLYIAISGKNKEDVLQRLLAAMQNPTELNEDNATVIHFDPDYQIDYQWQNDPGDAYLADIFPFDNHLI